MSHRQGRKMFSTVFKKAQNYQYVILRKRLMPLDRMMVYSCSKHWLYTCLSEPSVWHEYVRHICLGTYSWLVVTERIKAEAILSLTSHRTVIWTSVILTCSPLCKECLFCKNTINVSFTNTIC